jgi:hypothetical protein
MDLPLLIDLFDAPLQIIPRSEPRFAAAALGRSLIAAEENMLPLLPYFQFL